MAEVEHHGSAATAKLLAAENEIGSWIEDAERPTLADKVALRNLIRSIRLHVKVVRTS